MVTFGVGDDLRSWQKLDRFLDAPGVTGRSPNRRTTTLTRPRLKVISSTKWEVNITKKYRVASSAMVFKILGILSPDAFDRAATKMVNENARRSMRTRFRRGQHRVVQT